MSDSDAVYTGLVLAAGASRRMGTDRNKLLEPIGGRPMVAAPVAAFAEAGLSRIVVVVGFEAERVREALASGPPVDFVHHAGWEEGMGSSLAAGARAILDADGKPCAGVLVAVGDLPGLEAADVRRVLESHRQDPKVDRICVPTCRGRDGHPVLFGSAHLAALAALEGDRGARRLVDANADRVVRVESERAGIFRDVDTPEELDQARRAEE